MEELSVRIKIGDREYPMKVHPSEEQHIRMAGRLINDKMKSYESNFGIHDKQDLLAMVAFDAVVEKMRAGDKLQEDNSQVAHHIAEINQVLASVLAQS